MATADGLHGEAVVDDLLCSGGDLQSFFDQLGLEVAACGGGEGAEEELEWLSNKDAFPAVEEMDLELAVMGARRAQEELESLPNKDAFPTVEEMEQEPAVMGSRRKVVRRRRGAMSARPGQRRCRHCGTTKTPQWHRGAAGCRTLCNACGVRYKRERPEYAPSHQEGLEVGGGEALETMEAEPSEVGSQTKRVVRQRRTLAWPPTAAEPEQRWCQHCGKMKKPRWREGAAAEQEREWLVNKNPFHSIETFNFGFDLQFWPGQRFFQINQQQLAYKNMSIPRILPPSRKNHVIL
ncbi:GATA transcription factor 12 [Triticum urartu]|uniref:GATA transcription factor 12 n=1 Tax=Triticum urartu TaxID=4572 RepID=M7YQY1_TRIUA|nr:GATA transcription factor 12 [Triticum urartu]